MTVGRKRPGVRKHAGHTVINLDWTAVRGSDGLAVKKTQAVLIGEGTFLERLIENSIAAAKHGLIVDAVRKADTRTERFLVSILRAGLSVAARSRSKIGVGARNAACAGIGESRINRGKAIESFGRRNVQVVAQAVIQSKARANLVGILRVEGIVLITHSAECAVVQRRCIDQAKQRAGQRIAADAIQTGFLGIKIKFSRGLRKAPNVELQEARSASELHVVLSFNPADRIIQLKNVIRELRVAAVIQHALVRSAGKFHARESGVLHSGEPDLRGIALAKTVRHFSAEAAAEPEEELVDQRRSKNVVVADASVAGALRGDRPKNRTEVGSAAGIGVVVVKTA